ncbi:MAG TPA: hypothetical protein VLA20_09310 [Vicinamibacterales bacterium]|nr:hypothetical protein [Vicinamibacterales bacterium]
MAFLSKLLGKKPQRVPRIRICVECGMPIADHKAWCSIFRTQQEMDARTAKSA